MYFSIFPDATSVGRARTVTNALRTLDAVWTMVTAPTPGPAFASQGGRDSSALSVSKSLYKIIINVVMSFWEDMRNPLTGICNFGWTEQFCIIGKL